MLVLIDTHKFGTRRSLNQNRTINQSPKSYNAPVRYPTISHSEQKYANVCSEWCIVTYRTGSLWDL